jgi:hypothetical protein
MDRYGMKPYTIGGWVIVEIDSGGEVLLSNAKKTE